MVNSSKSKKNHHSSSNLIDMSEELQLMDYGYGSGGQEELAGGGAPADESQQVQTKRVDATIQFFAQPQERQEVKRTARRASIGGDPYASGDDYHHHAGGELLFVQQPSPQPNYDQQARFASSQQRRHRRASMGAAPQEHDYNGQEEASQEFHQHEFFSMAPASPGHRPRRGSVGGRSNSGGSHKQPPQSLDYNDQFYRPLPQRRQGRRASTGGGVVAPGSNYDYYNAQQQEQQQHHEYQQQAMQQQSTARSRTRRLSLNNAGTMDNDWEQQGEIESSSRKQGRRMSNGYNSQQQPRRMSNGYTQQQQQQQPRRMSNGYSQQQQPRRMSNGYFQQQPRRMSNGVTQQQQPRRMSNSYKQQPALQPPPPPPPEPTTLKFGINPDVVARMSRRMSGNVAQATSQGLDDDETEQDDDDDADYGYGDDAGGMGYGYAAPGISKRNTAASSAYERRGSNRSQKSASAAADSFGYRYGAPSPRNAAELPKYERRGSNRSQASSRSMRRNSCVIRPDQDPIMMQEIAVVESSLMADSDLELEPYTSADKADEGSPSDSDDPQETAEAYGYGSGGGGAIAPDQNYTSGEDSDLQPGGHDSGASDSERSMSSTRRMRRNSCLVRPDGSMSGGDQSYASGYRALQTGTPKRGNSSDDDTGMHLLQGMDDDEDYNDPDSLLNRSGYLNSVFKVHTKPKPTGMLGMHLARGKANNLKHEGVDEPSSDEESMLDVLNKAKEKKKLEADMRKRETQATSLSALAATAVAPATALDNEDKDEFEEDEELPHTAHDADLAPDTMKSPLHSHLTALAAAMPETNDTNTPPPHLVGLKSSAAARARPFTTPHVTLSADNLIEVQKYLIQQPPTAPVPLPVQNKSNHSNMILPSSARNAYNWGDIDFDSDGDDSEDSEMSFGASMYNDIQVFQELDRYKQLPRRRLSLDKTMIDMAAMQEERNSKVKGAEKRIPAFKAAAGCTIAADYILRPFCARMRTGLAVIKHNKSRWSKSTKRVIYLKEDGRTLTWKPCDDDITPDASKGKRPKLDLLKCREVRHAWEPDPESRKKTGTATTRAKCTKEGVANKTFSLIFSKRTLDVTAASSDQCKMLMDGFSALCFRLQLEKLQQRKQTSTATDDDSSDLGMCASGSFTTDNDWASTVYGGDETVSMTQSATSKAPAMPSESPWGL